MWGKGVDGKNSKFPPPPPIHKKLAEILGACPSQKTLDDYIDIAGIVWQNACCIMLSNPGSADKLDLS